MCVCVCVYRYVYIYVCVVYIYIYIYEEVKLMKTVIIFGVKCDPGQVFRDWSLYNIKQGANDNAKNLFYRYTN